MSPMAKWLGIGLVVSLAVNLFVIGAWAGRIARHGERSETERVTLGSMTDSLSPEGRTLLRSAMKNNRREAIPIFKQLKAAQTRAFEALDAEPYDADAYANALRDVRTYSEAGQTLLHATLVDIAAKLTPADRHRLAQESRKWLESRRHGDRRNGGIGGGPGRPGPDAPPPPDEAPPPADQ